MKSLTPPEVDQLTRTCVRYPGLYSAFILLALETGARCSELLSIKSSDLFPSDKTVFIKGSKKGKPRLFPLSPELFQMLLKLEGDRLFPFSRQYAVRIWHDYRPCRKPLHALRHTAAIRLYRKTKDVKLVQQLLGHRSINTTQIYLDLIYTSDELRKALF